MELTPALQRIAAALQIPIENLRFCGGASWTTAVCPRCGRGHDRLRWFGAEHPHNRLPVNMLSCRSCGWRHMETEKNVSESEATYAAWRARRERELAAAQAAAWQKAKALNPDAYRVNLPAVYEAWSYRYILPETCDMQMLGYIPQYTYYNYIGKEERTRPALTIPVPTPFHMRHNAYWSSIMLRILNDPDGVRYRPITNGLPAWRLYTAPLDPSAHTGQTVFLVEGPIKAIVVHQETGLRTVATRSVSITNTEMADLCLLEARKIIYMPDPITAHTAEIVDRNLTALRAAGLDVAVSYLDQKIDDLILSLSDSQRGLS